MAVDIPKIKDAYAAPCCGGTCNHSIRVQKAMEHSLKTTTLLPYPLEMVFPFFSNAANLERITPTELRFKILTPMPIEMKVGTLIDYRLSLFGIPFSWRTRIAEWEPPYRFADEQIRGPYALWYHVHEFKASGNQTEMSDLVRYRLPLGPLGDIALPLVRKQVNHIFSYRQRVIAQSLHQWLQSSQD